MSIPAGTRIADRYEVVRALGQGGMGDVVVARHLFLKQLVALKVIRVDTVPDKSMLARFEREAHIIAKFRGENVARVLDAGCTAEGMPFIAMELLSGQDLDAAVRLAGTLPPLAAVGYVLQVCEGLAEAHTMGIVHRDLKPANLFVTTRLDGSALVKILDFGISKAAPGVLGDSTGGQVTSTSATIGSPAFMSPEQLRSSRDVDERTDIWAIGVILYRICSGHLPFEGESITEVIVKVMTEPAPNLRLRASNIPEPLVLLVEDCLAKNREQRPAHVGVVAERLAPLLGAQGHESAQRISRIMATRHAFDHTVGATATQPPSTVGNAQTGTINPVATLPPASGPPRALWLALGLGAVAVALFAVAKQGARQGSTTPATLHSPPVALAQQVPPPAMRLDGGAFDAAMVGVPVSAPPATMPASGKRARQARPSSRPLENDDDLYGNRR